MTAPPRDLAPGAGGRSRLHLGAGNILIRVAGALRAPFRFGVRLVAFDGEGKVFLVRHSYLPGWHLPGGAVEPGETAREAAAREAREEGGLLLDAPLRLLNICHHATTGRQDHVAVFVATDVRRADAAGRGLEIRESGFFDPSALPEATTSATRDRIAEARGAAPPSDRW